MSHLMSSMKNIEQSADLVTFKKVPAGTPVRYHARYGAHRQGRMEFPALVLMQHPDDGSLDLIVFYEPEDMIWEKRVLPWREQEPHRCWSPLADETDVDGEKFEALRSSVRDLSNAVFGPYNEPPKSVMEHLADFEARLTALEKAVKKGK